jgi:hypothetical protein
LNCADKGTCWVAIAFRSAWIAAWLIDGVNTHTFGPNVAVTASAQRLAGGEGSALAPTAVAVSVAAPKSAALDRRRTIRRIRHLTVLEFPEERTATDVHE